MTRPRTQPPREKMPTLLDPQQSIDVSGAFHNCFFHCYALHLLANQLPLPDDLFTFQSISGSHSQASQLQKIFPNQRSLNVFASYDKLKNPNDLPLSPHFIVEKTLVLGILFREWFATKLSNNRAHAESLLLGEEGILKLYTNYFEFIIVDGGVKEQVQQQSNFYSANEAFLDYLIARPKPLPLSADENRFEGYFTATNEQMKEAIALYWKTEGYHSYCQYIANPQVKLTPADAIPVIRDCQQSLCIYNTDGTMSTAIPGTSDSKLEIVLAAEAGHYHLLKSEANQDLLTEYHRSYAQYLQDREAILAASDPRAQAASKSTLLVGAICPENHVPWQPFEYLLEKCQHMHTFTSEASSSISNDIDKEKKKTVKKTSDLPPVDKNSPPPNNQSSRDSKTYFFDQLSLLEKKYKNLQERKEEQAYEVAKTLYEGLLHEGQRYFDHPQTEQSYAQFKQHCTNLIEEAKEELETHRGFKQILGNIMLAILGAGVLYLIAAGIHLAATGKFLFFKTDSMNKIDAVEESIELAKPKNDP